MLTKYAREVALNHRSIYFTPNLPPKNTIYKRSVFRQFQDNFILLQLQYFLLATYNSLLAIYNSLLAIYNSTHCSAECFPYCACGVLEAHTCQSEDGLSSLAGYLLLWFTAHSQWGPWQMYTLPIGLPAWLAINCSRTIAYAERTNLARAVRNGGWDWGISRNSRHNERGAWCVCVCVLLLCSVPGSCSVQGQSLTLSLTVPLWWGWEAGQAQHTQQISVHKSLIHPDRHTMSHRRQQQLNRHSKQGITILPI